MKEKKYCVELSMGFLKLQPLPNWSLEGLARVYPHQVPWNTHKHRLQFFSAFGEPCFFPPNSFVQSWQQQSLSLPERGDGNNNIKKNMYSKTKYRESKLPAPLTDHYESNPRIITACPSNYYLLKEKGRGKVGFPLYCTQGPLCYSLCMPLSLPLLSLSLMICVFQTKVTFGDTFQIIDLFIWRWPVQLQTKAVTQFVKQHCVDDSTYMFMPGIPGPTRAFRGGLIPPPQF